jgi:NADH-quinone oxidoreductase subunit G
VNVEGRWQSWSGAAQLLGESRPGWKVLRVLANLLNVPGIDFVSTEEIRETLKTQCGDRLAPPSAAGSVLSTRLGAADTVAADSSAAADRPIQAGGEAAAQPWLDIPPYQVDVLVRGSESLAKTKDGHLARAVI